MKKTLKLIFGLITFYSSQAQEVKPIQKNQFNLKTNIQPYFYQNNDTRFDYTLEYERKVTTDLSFGASINYYSSKDFQNFSNQLPEKLNNSSLGFSLNVKYDWSRVLGLNTEKFDIYTGTSVGISNCNYYNLVKTSYYPYYSNNNDPFTSYSLEKVNSNNFFIGASIGVRYWFTKNLGVSLELDRSFYTRTDNPNKINLGISYKF